MTSRFPFPMPLGWFGVALSDEIAPGKSRGIHYFGQELVLFRGQNGSAHVMDAFCPHLGAHLGVGINEQQGEGAEVRDNTLVCPFHGWRFNGAGEAVEVPYATNMPPKAKGKCLKSWPTVEKNGVVWVWYHPNGEAPLWDVVDFAPTTDPDWERIHVRRWTIKTCMQEMAENAADYAHFPAVHKVEGFPAPELMEHDGHERRSTIVNILNTPQGEVRSEFRVYNAGPGQTYTWFTGLFETFELGLVTPIDDENIEVTFVFYQPTADRAEKAGLSKALIDNICQQLDEDQVIWEHKRYNENPILCDGDGPIARFRKWYGQFYV